MNVPILKNIRKKKQVISGKSFSLDKNQISLILADQKNNEEWGAQQYRGHLHFHIGSLVHVFGEHKKPAIRQIHRQIRGKKNEWAILLKNKSKPHHLQLSLAKNNQFYHYTETYFFLSGR